MKPRRTGIASSASSSKNRDSDVPEFRASRAAALEDGRKHYERLVETYGDAPDFIVSTADALFYLGRIYRELGEFGKSLAAFGEAERRYSALLEDESTARVDFVKNIALSKGALGELSVRSGQYSVARHYFTESSRFWTEARSREPVIAPVAALNIHENSLAIVECEFAMDRLDAAGDAAMSVGVRLTEMQKEDPDNHRIVGALAKSFALVGRVLEARRDNDLARQSYQQASDLYARAIELDAAVDEYHLGLGNSLARVGLLSNDHDKLEGAAEVLGRVVASNPYESLYLKTLADIYGNPCGRPARRRTGQGRDRPRGKGHLHPQTDRGAEPGGRARRQVLLFAAPRAPRRVVGRFREV